MNFQCRYTRARMNAFIHGELHLKARRRIARHLDGCTACHDRYVQQREVADQLSRRIVYLGQPRTPQLNRMWSAIQLETVSPLSSPRRDPRRYGLIALLLLLVVLFPWTMGNQNVPFTVPTQPVPSSSATASPRNTASRPAANAPVTVALRGGSETEATEGTPRLVLWNTPAPTTAQ